jgi:hypothetical protein
MKEQIKNLKKLKIEKLKMILRLDTTILYDTLDSLPH